MNNAKQQQASAAHKKQVNADEAKILASQLAKVEVRIPVKNWGMRAVYSVPLQVKIFPMLWPLNSM